MSVKNNFFSGVLVALVLVFVYVIYLGGLIPISFNERFVEEFSVISINVDGQATSYIDLELTEFQNFFVENEIESYRYVWILKENSTDEFYSAVVLDRVMSDKILESLPYLEMKLGNRDYYIAEFPYKNKFSFMLANIRIDMALKKEFERSGNILKKEMFERDLINDKLIYYFVE